MNEGVEIMYIDENQQEMTIHIGKIAELHSKYNKLQNNWNKLKKWLEEEKNRLATQVSNTYKDSLDKIHFVNEDIFNELNKVTERMQALENDNNE